MVDHSRATAEDIDVWLDEIDDTVARIRQHHRAARENARAAVRGQRDGYPMRSMPDSSVAGGRTSDPTAWTVEALAGGRYDAETEMATSDDTWQGQPDPTGNAVRNMARELFDGLNRLRGAEGSMATALPYKMPEPVREVCKTCGTNRRMVKQWIKATAQCIACYRRSGRQRAS